MVGIFTRPLPATWRLELCLHLLLFAAVADTSSMDIGGINLRVAWLMLPLVAFFIPRSPHDRIWFWLMAALVSVHLVSAVVSDAPVKGITYTGWIVFSYLFFFRTGIDLARRLGQRTWSIILTNGRLQIAISVLLVGLGMQERAHFTYYEPSYMAIGLVPYVFAGLFISSRRWLDGMLLIALVIVNQSANMLLVLSVAFVAWIMVTGLRMRTVIGMLAIPTIIGLLYVLTLYKENSANYNMAVYVRDNGMSWQLLQEASARGGNRVPRMEAAWEAARAHPLLGVGPGQYVEYTAKRDYSHITQGAWWLEPAGLPPTNVLLDATTSAGVLAAVLLVITFLVLHRVAVRCELGAIRHAIVGGLLCFALVLQFEANYLRGYVWLAFGLYAGLAKRPTPIGKVK